MRRLNHPKLGLMSAAFGANLRVRTLAPGANLRRRRFTPIVIYACISTGIPYVITYHESMKYRGIRLMQYRLKNNTKTDSTNCINICLGIKFQSYFDISNSQSIIINNNIFNKFQYIQTPQPVLAHSFESSEEQASFSIFFKWKNS